MYLKTLEINGFKSFAKKEALHFNSAISAIVGPNGSGKSNIAEAFRFVLGEQSMKTLRSKRGEDLIFNGTPEAPRANRASVKVIFDNVKRFLNLDFDEVIIERLVHRDGVNEYSLNGSTVRLKDVVELLAGAHIGMTGHHIISQGEADKILNANSKDRKAMLEDALGLKIYQYKRQESERKLDKTTENIKQVESLRREIAPHLRFLKKQVEKVEKVKELQVELKNLYLEYLKREQIYLEVGKKSLADKQRPLKGRLDELDRELTSAKQTLEKSQSRDAKSDELISLQGRITEIRTEKDKVLRELGRLEGEKLSQDKLLAKQKQILESAENKSIKLSQVEELAQSVEIRTKEGQLLDDVSKLKQLLLVVREMITRFVDSQRQGGDDGQIREIEQEIGAVAGKILDLEKHRRELESQENDLREQYQKLQQTIEAEKDTGREAEKAVFKIMAEQNEVNGELQGHSLHEEQLRHAEDDYRRELTEAGVLLGMEALSFDKFTVTDKSGVATSEEAIASEERSVQEDRRRQLEKIKIRLEENGASSADEIMKEYTEVSERDEFLARELLDLEKSAGTLKELIDDLSEKIEVEFREGVEKINEQFQVFFAQMFGGGTAELKIEKLKIRNLVEDEFEIDQEEKFEQGIDINVSLPRKRIRGLDMLSGGERSLTSIALVFAMSQVNPPPFLVLDETDAALDEANSRKYGDMIESLSKYSQLILITHNRETMSRAGVIYGVTMGGSGISKLLSIAFEEAVAVAK